MQRSPTCPHCLKNYEFKDFRPIGSQIPLLLSCGHAFCEGCLLRLERKNEELKCPTCEEVTQLQPTGEKGVKNLLPDIYLLGILTYNKRVALESGQNRPIKGPTWSFGNICHLSGKVQSKEKPAEETPEEKPDSSEESATQSTAKCEECDQPAACICKSCDDCFFCQNCFDQYHSTMKRLQKHQPLPISFPRKSDLECSEHEGRNLEFFDKELDQPVCALCIIDEKCKGHEIVPIGDVDQDLKDELDNSVAEVKKTLSLLQTSERVIANVLPEVTLMGNQFYQDVRDRFIEMHRNVQMREANILKEASEKFGEKMSLSALISDCIQKQKSITALIKEFELISKNPQVLRLKIKELLSKLEKFKDIECFAQRVDGFADDLKMIVDEDAVNDLKTVGRMEINNEKIVKMMKSSEVSEEELNLARIKMENSNPQSSNVEQNDIMTQERVLKFKHLTYEAAMLSQLRASLELVHVTYVKSPELFYVQRCADRERLQVMMQALNKYCRNTDKQEDLVFFVEKDDLVCAQYMGDNNWYRAKVIAAMSKQQPDVTPTWENGLPVEVHYLDYGNTECIPLARLRKIKQQFLEVPEIAAPCSLVDIVPPARRETWPLNAIKAFNSLVGEKQMLMNIRARYDGKLFVDLKRPEDDEPTQDDERPISVRDALIFLEVAKFISPASSASIDYKPPRSFKEPQLPQVEEIIDVLVTHVINPEQIYVQKFDSPITDVHNELAKLYSGKSKGGLKIPFPYRNLVCAAKFSEDRMWYRGLITHVHDDTSVDVTFVDYGNSEKTSFSEIKKLPDTYLPLRKQAMLVKLKDVAPTDGEWTKEGNDFLNVAILNKPMVMIVKEIEEGVVIVELCDTSTDEDVYINNLLVKKNYAISTGPSSKDKLALLGAGSDVKHYGTEADSEYSSRTDDLTSEASYSIDTQSNISSVNSFYPYPETPRERVFQVVGTLVDIQGFIYGHVKTGDTSVLRSISQKLNDGEMGSKTGIENTSELEINQPVVAQFSEDKLWYRASVRRIISTTHFEAEFVDFGNAELVHVNDVRLQSIFLDIPRQAVRLKLYGIEPAQGDGRYPTESHGTLNAIMVNKEFTATLEGIQRDPSLLNVSIKISTGEDLAQGLVKVGLARPVSSGIPVIPNDEATANQRVQHQMSLPATADFIEPTLPQIGVHFDISVTQVEKPNVVFVQRFPSFDGEEQYANDEDDTEEIAKEHIEELNRMSTLINSPEFFDDTYFLEKLNAGMPCCAVYSADEQWYRAKVISVSTNETEKGTAVSAEVLFVDYGTSEIVPIERIRRIPEDFLELPIQGICCELAGLYPPQSYEGRTYRDTKWPTETMKTLYTVVANKRMIATIMDYGPPVRILLFDRQNADQNETGEFNDVSVGKLLADAKLAIFDLHEDSNSNSTDEVGVESGRPPLRKKRTSSTQLFELPCSSESEG